ncbi:hypothetical protein [Haliscomenobacter sp.]|uniref:hypothetical protein n=1 Tax=Haliscomenobacter sp. TaxID=2717303 RepID=UPI003BACD142
MLRFHSAPSTSTTLSERMLSETEAFNFFPQSGRILHNRCAVSFRFIDPDMD